MPVAVLMTPFAEWLQSEMDRRGVNKSQLAAYIGTKPSVVGAWFTEDRIPSTPMCARLASYLHLPEEAVLRRAGHLPPVPDDDSSERQSPIPPWLITVFEPLTPHERDVVAKIAEETAHGLLQLREARSAPEAPPTDESPPPPAPPQAPRRSRRTPGRQGDTE